MNLIILISAGLLASTQLNAQTLEEQFNDCLRKASGDCPTIEDVVSEKLAGEGDLGVVEETITEPATCQERPYKEREFLFECTQEVTPWETLNQGPGEGNLETRPQGKIEKEVMKRERKGKKHDRRVNQDRRPGDRGRDRNRHGS